MSGPVVRARGLEKRFGAVRALCGVDLTVAPHGRLAVLGPNGAGKSTLLRILAGLSQPSAGTVDVGQRASRRAAIGYLGHASLLYGELSARENLIFAARLHGVPAAGDRADRLLEEEGLADVANRRAGTFSRGMAQRLSIARARVHDPELLLLDEPFTGLDLRASERLTSRLRALGGGTGPALVLVTHDVRQAAELADEVVILLAGRIVDRRADDALDADSLAGAYAAALDEAGSARAQVAGR